MIDFSIPQWLEIYYYSIGTVSLILNSFTLYLVIFRSDKIDSFRYYLLTFQVNCTITDIHTTILMQPFPLMPMIAGHYKGLIGSFFNVNPYYHVAFSITSIITQVEALVFCFYRKHQTIAKVMNGHVCPKAWNYFIGTTSIITPIFFFYGLCEAGMTKEEKLEFVKTNFPESFREFSTVTNVAFFTLNIWMLSICGVSVGGGIVSGLAYTATTIDLFAMLRRMRKRVSAYNYQRHRSAVYSLLAQFTASSILLSPPLAYMVMSVGNYENSQQAVRIILAIFSLRSTVNAIVLIVTTPPYRIFVLRIKPQQNFAAVSANSTHPLQQQ